MRYWHKLLLAVVALAIVSPIAYIIYAYALNPMLAKDASSVVLTVDKNTPASVFVRNLQTKGLFAHPRLLLYIIKLQGITSHLQAGIYEVLPNETVWQLVRKVSRGEVLVHSFNIIAGTTVYEVKANLAKAAFLHSHSNDWQDINAHYVNPEGLLLADTYYYNAGSEARSVLKLAHFNLARYLDSLWQTRSPNLPYKTPYELLIAASIIEKESALAAERKLISGIIVNRLQKNMPLQMDPTVAYALGPLHHSKLTRQDLSINSPYNTYRVRGLPPTPISMVDKTALEAAAHPDKTQYLYFVAKGDGSHQFSVTYAEQQQAIAQYRDKNIQ